jgi:hypothetical protein
MVLSGGHQDTMKEYPILFNHPDSSVSTGRLVDRIHDSYIRCATGMPSAIFAGAQGRVALRLDDLRRAGMPAQRWVRHDLLPETALQAWPCLDRDGVARLQANVGSCTQSVRPDRERRRVVRNNQSRREFAELRGGLWRNI